MNSMSRGNGTEQQGLAGHSPSNRELGHEHDDTKNRAGVSPFRVQSHSLRARQGEQAQGWQLGAAQSPGQVSS